mgnify:FL=1
MKRYSNVVLFQKIYGNASCKASKPRAAVFRLLEYITIGSFCLTLVFGFSLLDAPLMVPGVVTVVPAIEAEPVNCVLGASKRRPPSLTQIFVALNDPVA